MSESKGIGTEQLHIGYRFDLVRDICLKAAPGQILTLIGPNGCGKTTLLKTLTGELKDRGGVVFLDGEDRLALSATEIAKRMSMVMTYRIRPELMTCREVVEVGRYPYTGRLGILSAADREKVDEAMIWTDVKEIENELFQNISDGQKQRVLLSRAICQEPKILILDEPTSYLDIRHKIELLQKIRLFAKEKNAAVVMSLHELEIAGRISDTVAAIGDGRVLKTGSPEEVLTEDFIRKLYHIENMETDLLGAVPWLTGRDGCPGSGKRQTDEMPKAQAQLPDAASAGKSLAKVIMIQGSMSGVGKSAIAAGLCRIFSDDGYRVAPFKSQNMALNSCVTAEGLEMGRAQVMQAECARIEPCADMNPILLKPTSDMGSQVIVNGKVMGNMKAAEYFRHKKELKEDILNAYRRLSEKADIIVVEGAGSPAEMNLKEDDIVNMGLAEMIDAPVLLIGDIDRGGVFAQLLGTLDLLEKHERARVKGLIVNKFRGDIRLFDDGIRILSEKGNTKVVGVVPYLSVNLDDEDSLSERLDTKTRQGTGLDIAIIRLKHISNFTDFVPLEQIDGVSVRYVSDASGLGEPDLILLPGSKNTIDDLIAIRENGLADAVLKCAEKGTCIIGICGGYQMLGRRIEDPEHTETGGSIEGLALLPVDTVLQQEKTRDLVTQKITGATGILAGIEGILADGYEIHLGTTVPYEAATEFTANGSGYCRGNVYGTYLHGFFDKRDVLVNIIERIAKETGKAVDMSQVTDYKDYKERQYDLLATSLREHLDMAYIYGIMGLKK